MTINIGFIGLGAMGAPMLARLAGGACEKTVFGFDADQETTNRACREADATPCSSIGELVDAVSIVFTCVPDDTVLKEVYLGPGGIKEASKPGMFTVDCSTVSPRATRVVHAGLETAFVSHLDACMLGSVSQARDGTITFVVGGSADALESVMPYLEKLGGLIRHCGGSGAGNTMKLLHQTLVAGHAVAVGEALALCEQVGADADIFYEIVTQGTGFAYSRYFEKRLPRMRDGDFSPLFMMRFMAKDARLARDMLGDTEIDPKKALPALQAVIETLEEGEHAGLGDLDFSAALRVVRSRLKG